MPKFQKSEIAAVLSGVRFRIAMLLRFRHRGVFGTLRCVIPFWPHSTDQYFKTASTHHHLNPNPCKFHDHQNKSQTEQLSYNGLQNPLGLMPTAKDLQYEDPILTPHPQPQKSLLRISVCVVLPLNANISQF